MSGPLAVHLYRDAGDAGGAIRHVAVADELPADPQIIELDATRAPVALGLVRAQLDDGAGNRPARAIVARELLEALELDELNVPRFKPDAPPELRGLRLRPVLPPAPPDPPPPPPELLAAAPRPSMWRRMTTWLGA